MNRIRTTHVGSLIRPPALLEDLEAIRRGDSYDRQGHAQRLTDAVADVVQRQRDVGIDIVGDGEMSKTDWINYVYGRVSGIESRTMALTEQDLAGVLPTTIDREALRGSEGRYANFSSTRFEPGQIASIFACSTPITYDPQHAAVDADIANLRRACDRAGADEGFITAVAPGSLHWIANEYYASEEEFVYAFADALRVEYRRIVDAGFLLQVDDAVMWHKYGTIRVQGGTAEDYRRWAHLRVDALNHALQGIPRERVRYHICSGSEPGPHTIDPELSDIIDEVLRVDAGCLLLEQANARHEHEWRVWERVTLPDDMVLAPGVVSHHTMMVEHPDLVAERLVRIAELVGPDRLIASTDCGFSQMAPKQRVPLWTQWAKLESLAEGARIASERIWGSVAAA